MKRKVKFSPLPILVYLIEPLRDSSLQTWVIIIFVWLMINSFLYKVPALPCFLRKLRQSLIPCSLENSQQIWVPEQCCSLPNSFNWTAAHEVVSNLSESWFLSANLTAGCRVSKTFISELSLNLYCSHLPTSGLWQIGMNNLPSVALKKLHYINSGICAIGLVRLAVVVASHLLLFGLTLCRIAVNLSPNK